MDSIEKKAKDLNQSKLQEEFHENQKKFLTVKKIVPTCTKTAIREFAPTFRVPTDVIAPDGRVIARAGEVLNTLEVMKRNNMSVKGYMMFIDSTDDIQVQLSYMYQNQGKVFLVNGNMQKYEKYTNIPTFKADAKTVEKFGVKCSPTLLIQNDNTLVLYEYNPKDIEMEEE